MIHKTCCLALCLYVCAINVESANAVNNTDWDSLDHYNVYWPTPSSDSSGSMPLGNGEIGLNVWAEPNGDILFYISRTDAWSENGRLLKLGKVRLTLTPNPFVDTDSFSQQLKLREGLIEFQDSKTNVVIWADANQPAVRIEVKSETPVSTQCKLELWRTQQREIKGFELTHGMRTLAWGPVPIIEYPDTLLPAKKNQICWYYRNETSVYPLVLKNQRLEGFLSEKPDPLLHRTFGGCITAEGFVNRDSSTLQSTAPSKHQIINIHLMTSQTDTIEQWSDQLNRQVNRVQAIPLDQARNDHLQWWNQFWQRSWIFIDGDQYAETITRSYILQRFLNACAGRGIFPIKFNGSIFTMDLPDPLKKNPHPEKVFNPDYRRWGGNYWVQNTRLIYWTMLCSGDTEMMLPWFRMYKAALPMAHYQTQQHFHHPGAYYPESMHFWGNCGSIDFGWDNPGSIAKNAAIQYYWSGAIEVIAMMLDYYQFTQDAEFFRNTLLPIAEEVLLFYEHHWPRDKSGKISFHPITSLETWREVTNPTPEIAGLNFVIKQFLALPDSLITKKYRHRWQNMLEMLPPIPLGEDNGVRFILPAEKFAIKKNVENPELYAVFPYRIYGIGKPDLPIGQQTFRRRLETESGGWQQHAVQAAYLGLTDDAAREVISNFTSTNPLCRFPIFWSPNYDWTPDQCHGNVPLIALQRMLLQWQGDKIHLLPAWPKQWNVKFKLCVPKNTTIQGYYKNGQIHNLKAHPKNRLDDIISEIP